MTHCAGTRRADPERIIQPPAIAELGNLLGGRTPGQKQLRGIAGRQAHRKKDDNSDQDQGYR